MPEITTAVAAAVALAFLAGGVVKGALGIGLPLVALPIMSFAVPVQQAVAFATVPLVVSNLWQALDTRLLGQTLRRFWPLLLAMVVTMAAAIRLQREIDQQLMGGLLGLGFVGLALVMLWKPNLTLETRHEKRWSGGVGLIAGLIGALTALYGFAVILYLTALRLSKEEFVGSISIIYLAGGVTLLLGLAGHGILQGEDVVVSTAALVPLLLGMVAGQRLRQRIGQLAFRRLVLGVLLIAAGKLLYEWAV